MIHNISGCERSLPRNIDVFICSNGFEKRWKRILLAANLLNTKEVLLIDRFGLAPDCVDYSDIDKSKIKFIDIINDNQIVQWNNIFNSIVSKIQLYNDANVVIDITCIPQLALYSIICQLHLLNIGENVVFTYSGASRYNIKSISSSDSRVNTISTVLGYPGVSKPSCNKQHLILLVGFDFDLAITLIRDLEPTSISLGLGDYAFQSEFHKINLKYLNKIKRFALGQISEDKINIFEFSCSDYKDAISSISKEIRAHEDMNVVMCAMNTKISSIASAKAALEHDFVKMCHIEPMFRSVSDYSEDSDVISIFHL